MNKPTDQDVFTDQLKAFASQRSVTPIDLYLTPKGYQILDTAGWIQSRVSNAVGEGHRFRDKLLSIPGINQQIAIHEAIGHKTSVLTHWDENKKQQLLFKLEF